MERTTFTDKEKLGLVLEDFIRSILKKLCPEEKGFRFTFPDKKNYNNHNGVDFRVFWHNKEILAIECKNWRKLAFKYGLDNARTEIKGRFHHIGTNNKLTIISYSDVLTDSSIRELSNDNIKLLSLNKLVGGKDFRSDLYKQTLGKLSSFIKSAMGLMFNSSSSIQSCIRSICSDSSKSSNDILNNNIPTTSNTPKTEPKEAPSNRFPDRERFLDEPRCNIDRI
jgi:hypothetical protein